MPGLFLLDQLYDWNVTVFAFEILALILSLLMILVGLLQNKQGQQGGLAALNGGNEELFFNTKERGLDYTLSKVMLVLGLNLFLVTIVIAILSKLFLTTT